MSGLPKRKLVLSNLDVDQNSDDVLKLCRMMGKVIHFNRPPLQKNFAFVTFEELEDAQKAYAEFRKRNVTVKYAKDDSMTHNSLPSFDANSNAVDKAAIVRNDFKSRTSTCSDDGLSDSGPQNCSRCSIKSDLQCERCGDYYCSVECQKADWSRHRQICFPMPRLIPARSVSIAAVNRNVSATSSPQRRRVEMHDTPNGDAKSIDMGVVEPIRKPQLPLSPNQPKTARQPMRNEPLTLPRKPHNAYPSSTDDEVPKVPPTKATNGASMQKPIDSVTTAPQDQTKSPPPSLPEKVIKAETPAPVASPPPSSPQKVINAEMPAPVATPPKLSIADCEVLQNGGKVRIVYAGNHYSAFVRSVESDQDYYALLTNVSAAAAHAPKLKDLPQRNDVVSAPYLGAHYRAVVIKAQSVDQPIQVAFMDFGNVEMVMFDKLKELSAELISVKRYATRVRLESIDPEIPNESGFALLKKSEENEKHKFFIRCDSGEPTIAKDSWVKLIDSKTGESLNDKLKPMKKEPRFAKLDANCKRVMILDVALLKDGKVACTDVKNKKGTVANEQTVQNCAKALVDKPPYKPKVNEKCLVKIVEEEEWWYRAVCQKVNGTKAQLYLLDSGKMHTASLDDIREFPEKCDFESLTTVATIMNVSMDDGVMSKEDLRKLTNNVVLFEDVDVEQVDYDINGECLITFKFKN